MNHDVTQVDQDLSPLSRVVCLTGSVDSSQAPTVRIIMDGIALNNDDVAFEKSKIC